MQEPSRNAESAGPHASSRGPVSGQFGTYVFSFAFRARRVLTHRPPMRAITIVTNQAKAIYCLLRGCTAPFSKGAAEGGRPDPPA